MERGSKDDGLYFKREDISDNLKDKRTLSKYTFPIFLLLLPLVLQILTSYLGTLEVKTEIMNYSGGLMSLFLLASISFNVSYIVAFILSYAFAKKSEWVISSFFALVLILTGSLVGNLLSHEYLSDFNFMLPIKVGGILATSVLFGWLETSLIVLGGVLLGKKISISNITVK